MKIINVLSLCLIVSIVHADAVLDDFSTLRKNGAGDPLWQPYIAQNVDQKITVENGMLKAVGSQTNATPISIVGVSATNPAVVTTATPAPWHTFDDGDYRAGDGVTFSGITGAGCSALNAHFSIHVLTPTTFALYQTAGLAQGVDATGCSYAGGGVGQACVNIGLDGCGMYWSFVPLSGPPSTYLYPANYAQGYIKSGTWDPDNNHLTWKMMCSKTVTVAGGGSINFGTYDKGHQCKTTADCPQTFNLQGTHYYHNAAGNFYAGHWATVEMDNVSDHEVGHQSDASINRPPDPEFWSPSTYNNDGIQDEQPVKYMDGLTRFYMQTSGASPTGDQWSGETCYLSDFVFSKSPASADAYTKTLTASYTGTAYEANWNAPFADHGGNGTEASYQIRYAPSSLKAIGFSHGTEGGIARQVVGNASAAGWTSPPMAEAPSMYVGIRPIMLVKNVVNASPIVVSTLVDSMIPTGSHVHVEGVGGTTSANGDWTVTTIPPQGWRFSDHSLVSLVISGSVATVTTASPHHVVLGGLVAIIESPGTGGYDGLFYVSAITGPNTFQFKATGGFGGGPIPDGTYTDPGWALYAYSALSLDGSVGNGAYTSGGTITSTDETMNFREIAIQPGPVVVTDPTQPPPTTNPPQPPGGGGPVLTPSALHVQVYPNPWRKDKHATKNITFDGLPMGTTIKIFTTSGHKVQEIKTDGPKVEWPLTNQSGDKVASGVYMYLITDSQGNKVKGKVGVIK